MAARTPLANRSVFAVVSLKRITREAATKYNLVGRKDQ